MQKKKILFAAVLLVACAIGQHVFAQTCAPDEVLMSKGCVCGYKQKYACQSKCVKSRLVSQYLKHGWYLGECNFCCPVFKSANEKSDLAKQVGKKYLEPRMAVKR